MRQRLAQLDGIRGIAALVVVVHHYVTALPHAQHDAWGWLFRFPPLRLLVAGHAAVVIFFVLSGCVLSLAYRRAGQQPAARTFICKRVVRLYPTYAAALLVALALHYVSSSYGSGSWTGSLAGFWKEPPTHADLTGAFLLSGTTAAIDLDSPSWSLVHEMRLAVLLPILLPLTIAWPGRTLAFGAMTSLLVAACLPFVGVHDRVLIGADSVAGSLLISLYYAVFFSLGAWLPSAFQDVGERPTWSWRRIALLVVALTLLQLPQSMPFVDVAFGLAAAALVGLGLSGAFGVLEVAPIQAVGQRSFSLYLVHFPALQLAYVTLDPGRPLAFLAVYVAAIVCLTVLLYEAVERPFATLCSRIGRETRPSRVGAYPVARSSRDI